VTGVWYLDVVIKTGCTLSLSKDEIEKEKEI
jgi:hypothetical protein